MRGLTPNLRGTQRSRLTLLGMLLVASTAAAQQPAASADPRVIGAQYDKGWLHRLLLGNGYRRTWATPVDVPILDLEQTAGGLTPLRPGRGIQTRSLRFQGGDGRQYVFRSILKDANGVLPEALRETLISNLINDQMSAAHPVGALVVSRILDAVGVLHVQPRLVRLPDSPRLGAFRAEFAGAPGLLEERPRDDDNLEISFAGAQEVVSTPDLRFALENRSDLRLDTEAFLDARLLDVFLGDWDRHQDQWRWARVGETGSQRWVPIPRDRDQAFAKFGGWLLVMARLRVPQLVAFGPEYSPIEGATWSGRDLDREFLPPLSHQTWRDRATALQALLTDHLLAEAMTALPPEWQAAEGGQMLAALRARRDRLPELAETYYRFLAREVDIWATDDDEIAFATTDSARSTTVTVAPRSRPDQPWYRRTFHPSETREVRVHLRGGQDSASVVQAGRQTIRVRVIGGLGADAFVTDDGGKVRLYDQGDETRAAGAGVDRRPFQSIERPGDPTSLPHRDWGHRDTRIWRVALTPDAGAWIGISGSRTGYAFRHRPYGSLLTWSVRAAFGAGTGRAEARWRSQAENSTRFLQIEALGSGIEILRWYGLGNTTTRDPSRADAYYRATEHQARLHLAVGWQLAEHLELQVGPRTSVAVTELDEGRNADRFIAVDAPYGTGNFAQVGVGGAVRFDSRDVSANARRGVLVELDGVGYPAWLDVDQAFVRVHGRIATYLSASAPTQPVLALLAGGSTTFGAGTRIPFHELAFLGSATTLRGFQTNRFAGQHAAYGSAELRLQLSAFPLLIPGRQGVFGFGDVGRVWVDGEVSDQWHSTVGGGIWLGAVSQGGVISTALASSDEGTRLHIRIGFAW